MSSTIILYDKAGKIVVCYNSNRTVTWSEIIFCRVTLVSSELKLSVRQITEDEMNDDWKTSWFRQCNLTICKHVSGTVSSKMKSYSLIYLESPVTIDNGGPGRSLINSQNENTEKTKKEKAKEPQRKSKRLIDLKNDEDIPVTSPAKRAKPARRDPRGQNMKQSATRRRRGNKYKPYKVKFEGEWDDNEYKKFITATLP